MEQFGLLIAAMTAPVNIGYTIFLLVILLYWLLVIVGALDIDLFHIDADVHGGLDLDGDIHAGGDLHAEGDVHSDADGHADSDGNAGGVLLSVLHFFNVGEIPLMVFVSVLVLSMWAVAMTVNVVLNNQSLILGIPIFFGNLFVSAFVAKFVTAPIKRVFKALEKDCENMPKDEMIGRTCVISTSEVTEDVGQAVIETRGAPLILNIVAYKGEKLIKGEEAVVIEYLEDKRVYAVKSRWAKED